MIAALTIKHRNRVKREQMLESDTFDKKPMAYTTGSLDLRMRGIIWSQESGDEAGYARE